MGELGMFVLFVGGLGLLPAAVLVVLVLRLVKAERSRQGTPIKVVAPCTLQLEPCGLEERGGRASSEPFFVSTLLIALRAQPQDAYIDPETYAQGAFDLTIKRRHSVIKKRVRNLGGEAEVPMVLQDNYGTSFLTHQKVFLN